MSEKRTIRNLTEQERFVFSDGAKPTENHLSDLYAVNDDSIISYVGISGRIVIESNMTEIGRKKLLKWTLKNI